MMKRLLTLLLTALTLTPTLLARDFQYDGITYSVVNEEDKTCHVARNENAAGDIVLPSTVSDGHNNYSVIGINSSAFGFCQKLTSISLPNTVSLIPFCAFESCRQLTTVVIPESVTYIGEDAFHDCSALTNLSIPNSVTYIGKSAFSSCNSLQSLSFPESIRTIDRGAFQTCQKLKYITLPNSIVTLGVHAFWQCENIKHIYYLAPEPIVADRDCFSDNTYANAVLHVAAESVDKIHNIKPWYCFAKIEQSGIDEIEADIIADDDEVYTLQGVRAAKPLRSGVYVSNGRKVLVR